MALDKTWAERCEEGAIPPQPMDPPVVDHMIGGNSPGVVYGVIENTAGNTPMNRATGPIRKMPGFASRTGESENPYEWINAKDLGALGSFPYSPTGVDRG